VAFSSVQKLDAGRVVAVGHAATEPSALILADIASGAFEVLRRPSSASVTADCISRAEPISFASAGGRTAHALFYAPRNDGFRASSAEKPPLIVQAHGGPTASASPAFQPIGPVLDQPRLRPGGRGLRRLLRLRPPPTASCSTASGAWSMWRT